ncbi:MAG: hypothetical protein OEW44_02675 [Gemmatimonadota bacterium]|jgi:hypothetical protein|nr:hypothetical protein [Gemmatimonadota bacterium]
MAKSDDKRIAALARKNAAKTAKPKTVNPSKFDDTLRIRPQEEDPETRRFFKEMKRREF